MAKVICSTWAFGSGTFPTKTSRAEFIIFLVSMFNISIHIGIYRDIILYIIRNYISIFFKIFVVLHIYLWVRCKPSIFFCLNYLSYLSISNISLQKVFDRVVVF